MGLHRGAKIVAALAIVGLLALALRGPVASLEEPLVRLWWIVRFIPEQLIWSAVALLGFVLAVSLGHGPRTRRLEAAGLRPSPQTQHQRLSELIELARTSPWARDVVSRRLRETAAVLRALREGVHRDDAREEIRTGQWLALLQMTDVSGPKREGTGSEGENYTEELAGALSTLECYAQGGTFERN